MPNSRSRLDAAATGATAPPVDRSHAALRWAAMSQTLATGADAPTRKARATEIAQEFAQAHPVAPRAHRLA